MNLYEKYWKVKEKEWHENEIGTYHISAIGVSHQDLEPEEHSGPCLRDKYFVYLDGENHSLETEGNFDVGNLFHKDGQRIYKLNNPNSVGEFPLVYQLDESGDIIMIKGSVDIVDFEESINPDFKTGSMFTFPTSEYDMSPTNETQVTLYTYILNEFVFRPTWYRAEAIRIVYFKKHNKTTMEQPRIYTDDKGLETYNEFVKRVLYFDKCLKNEEIPDAEPHKWCKYCHKLDYCIEQGDLIQIKDGRKKRIVKNE